MIFYGNLRQPFDSKFDSAPRTALGFSRTAFDSNISGKWSNLLITLCAFFTLLLFAHVMTAEDQSF
jgi:hypothetical protein